MIVAAGLIVSWLCGLTRTAFGAVERTRVEDGAKEGKGRSQVLLRLLDNPPRSLLPVTVLDTAALIAIACVVTWENAPAGVSDVGWALSSVLAIWLLGRLGADALGASRATTLAELAAPLLSFLGMIARPFLSFNQWLLRAFRATPPRLTERVTSDDIQIIVTEGNQERKLEEIEPEEREMIAGIIEMSERTARDIMVPRPDVIALQVGASLDEALDVATRHGHSRLPLFQGDIDHVAGILHVKDLIQAVRHPERTIALRDLMRPVHYIPDTAKADDLLRDMLRTRVHMAVVVDEYGGTVGVVTIEDALEEIVGEIRDEYDAAEEPDYVRVNEDQVDFTGRVPIAEVNDVMGIHLPTEDSDTLGGLVYTLLGRMPKTGDRVHADSTELQVTATAGRRIKKVRVTKQHQDENNQDAAEKENETTH